MPTSKEANRKIGILLVDGHPVTRLGIRSLLETTEDLLVVAETGEAEEAVRLAARLQPNLVILDVRLGETGDGMEGCRAIGARPNPPRILLHSAYSRSEDLAAAAVAGADGYFHKGEEYLEFPGVVRRVCGGERVWFVDSGAEPQPDPKVASRGARSLRPRSAGSLPSCSSVIRTRR